VAGTETSGPTQAAVAAAAPSSRQPEIVCQGQWSACTVPSEGEGGDDTESSGLPRFPE
jgi:hypothetical protein